MNKETSREPIHAFTLVELMVLCAVIAILCSLALPSMARVQHQDFGVGCLSGLKKMQAGWEMYAQDHNGMLMPNPPGALPANATWCIGHESWFLDDANTNPAPYLASIMSPYIGNDLRAYKCPADLIPSQNGPRIRSRSMNGQMGTKSSVYSFNYKAYASERQITCPPPSSAFVFCDESPLTLGDGYLELDLGSFQYADLPASYHAGGCGFSFADGHAELHHWELRYIQQAVVFGRELPGYFATSGRDSDYLWLSDHSACRQTVN